mmetsp:Transcript_24319/g.59541  ORF Transcript_24319/g.59541 Transcript_24319/m.59541 type:complete len:919 (+) Transcript_24319:274-3030(+)|eukprot:CAMPEP_0113621082 /NCGR_PEP_ID=MMETSP0017_2-20120614/10765_1 /TAXON_ID=2856 /ORGANISM="Cylindrotheca closterium" /LENGTH=918 /DNA_ID=CAMNT_0000530803 /DNA_START=223 /DNA_END=2979 /DNA_ORIENTATION=- /assembly_acc=CAM_ASM_000147
MANNTSVMDDFKTPDRKPSSSDRGQPKVTSSVDSERKISKPATVTPAESTITREPVKAAPPTLQITSSVESPEDKHVRFDKKKHEQEVAETPEAKNRRGAVSRRGGRSGSPGRPGTDMESTVLEFKTFRSPQRKREESDNVPSLCSSSSAEKEKERPSKAKAKDAKDTNSEEQSKPASISCDANMNQTSPLGEGTEKSGAAKSKPTKSEKSEGKKNNVTFSPVPPTKENVVVRTPTRTPTKGNFQTLPNLDDATLRSPGGFFLSPQPGTPSYRALQEAGSFDTTEMGKDSKKDKIDEDGKPAPMRSPKTPKSPRTPRREDRDRFIATPTDFAADYGKHPNSSSFDSSNVLAWLQSPTSNGLFSPGGFASMLNTPRGAPRTPRTPTVSTSFFFSDVAGLPRSGDYTISPKPGENGKRGGRGYSNIICISPLASSKTKNGTSHTPPAINYRDMFASPEGRAQNLSFLGDSPAKGLKARGTARSANRDPSLDAVHLAERDLMEDEDLSVLLQLASNTPSRTAAGERPATVSGSDGTHVFRPPKSGSGDENLPSLQLPIIGGRDNQEKGARLARKTHSRDHGDPAEGYRMHPEDAAKAGYAKGKKMSDKTGDKRKDGHSSDGMKKPIKQGSLHPPRPPYPLPHPYEAHPGGYYMPPGMPHGGNMRVVVGGPPPPPRGKTSGSPNRPPHGPRPPYPMGPSDPNYPPPPYPPPPGHYHHPGVPPHHMHPHYGHYPPHHHPPPPRAHMPLYGAQHPPGKGKAPKKLPKAPKPGTKRPLSTTLQKGSSKKKKPSPPKKKNKSPQLTDKVERQKAAATIQAVNAASGGKNDKAAALAAAILRGVTMRPSGKWQAQLYFAGKSRYIGVFDTREKAALAYEIAREKLKSEKSNAEGGQLSPKATEAAVTLARKAAFEGVNERDPRLAAK